MTEERNTLLRDWSSGQLEALNSDGSDYEFRSDDDDVYLDRDYLDSLLFLATMLWL
jgi:hypothetical protein